MRILHDDYRRDVSDARDGSASVPSPWAEIGAAWCRASRDGVADGLLSVAVPKIEARKLYANLGRAAGQDDDNVFAVV